MFNWIERRTRFQKGAILVATDALLIPLAGLLALLVQMGAAGWEAARAAAEILPLLLVLAAAFSIVLGIPRIKLNTYEAAAMGRTAVLAACAAACAVALGLLAGLALPTGTYLVFGMLFFLLSVASRLAMRALLRLLRQGATPRTRVLIYGAGMTGVQLAAALKDHDQIQPVAFADDSPALQGLQVAGLTVLHPARIAAVAGSRRISRVLLAMPSLPRAKQAQIAAQLQRQGLEVQVLPSFAQLVGEDTLLDKLEPVSPAARATYAGKCILVSGAGGSIGSELCRQILAFGPSRLILFELGELALYTVEMDLRPLAEGSGTDIVPVLGSVTDPRAVRRVMTQHRVDVVLHAAAYKHVPLVEANPVAGLANNVLGTRTLARASAEAGVGRFILISTDKAVRPTNVMGASKRLSELVVQDLASRSRGTVFAMVRFGNVLGSSGSVIPLFQSQIARGGPVTLTHDDVTRYFMTIEEAVRLVLLAGAFARGGEVFVLDMGAPVAIRDLARQIIVASGYTVRDAANPRAVLSL